MTRTEYLKQLDNYLHRLPEEDYQEAMEYFTEYFDEAGPENEDRVIEELGTPKEAAQDILNALWDKKEGEADHSKKSRAKILWIAILALFAAPLALPAIILVAGLIFAFIAMIFAFVVAALSLLLAGIAVLGVLIWESFTLVPNSLAAMALGIGTGLLVLGIGLLLWLLLIALATAMTRVLLAIISRFTKKGSAA
ncbi:hypothetical protein SAG0136_03215 [Streptococcus agalactiae LMG 14747]|uniref:DUF1700 domain-containing protein n=1 Tax=Streptococcus agalactiae LMG 14747 TaxID=1154860 RepID=V6Z088_STRAG|nr:DUF1700 domain-containing protein [Streptococcus hyovaginalis]ESV54282.1 hypothetical protein SAG0136_03215 [Streptococcus agalactiae LMG 14747]